MSSLADVLAKLGGPPRQLEEGLTPKCPRCGLHAVGQRGSLCDACLAASIRARRVASLRVARESIPAVFRDLDAQEVRRRVRVGQSVLDQAQAATTRLRTVLVGAAGFGKTTLACWMLSQAIDRGIDGSPRDFERARWARFVDAPRLCKAVREHPLGQGEAPLLAAALRASVLVLDDVGQELDLRAASNPVVDVIRERHGAGRATWVTTFLTPPAFEKAYGSGTARRVFDGALTLGIGLPS